MHEAMLELHWLPSQVLQLTIPQLVCLLSKDSPGKPKKSATFGDFAKNLAEKAEREKAWCS